MRKGQIKKYLIFMRSGYQTVLAYRGAILLWFIGAMISAVLMGLVWWAIFYFSPETQIGGYVFPQMLMYVILSAVVSEAIYTDTMGTINEDVKWGLIGMRLMKPINYRVQLGFSAMGSFLARIIIIGVPVITVGTLVVVFGFGLTGIQWYNVLLFLPMCVLSAIMFDTFGFLFGQLAFRTQAMFGVASMSQIVMSFLSGGIVPIALFPAWAQTALYYTPFPTLVSLPVRIFLGQVGWTEMLIGLAISVAWIAVLNVLAHLAYLRSVKHVVVFGG
ncbi:MAG: ABC-2 family transporter protein [Clostridiales bacterium]|nr:ABC-2 family transporter protein [Clostridiales bacterium]